MTVIQIQAQSKFFNITEFYSSLINCASITLCPLHTVSHTYSTTGDAYVSVSHTYSTTGDVYVSVSHTYSTTGDAYVSVSHTYSTTGDAYVSYRFSTKQYRALYTERSNIFTGFVYSNIVYTTADNE